MCDRPKQPVTHAALSVIMMFCLTEICLDRIYPILRRIQTGTVRPSIVAGYALFAFVALASAGATDGYGQDKPTGAQKSADAKSTPNENQEAHANLVGHGGPVKSVVIGQESKRALTGSFDYSMIYWDISVKPPKILSRIDDHNGAVNVVRFLPGSKRAISADDDGKVSLWDLKTGKRLHLFEGHTAKIVDLSLSSDGAFAVTASWDRTARIWNLKSLKPGPILKGHHGPVNASLFSKFEGRSVVYSASYDGTIRRWNFQTGALENIVYRHGWGINVLKVLKGGAQLVFGSLNGARGVVDPAKGTLIKNFPRLENPVLAMATDPNELFVAFGSAGGKVQVYTASNFALVEEHQNPYGPIFSLAFAKYGVQIYYGGLDDFIVMWQVSPRKPFEPLSSRYPRRFQKSENLSLGERQFARKCSICHTLNSDGANRAGPTLFGVFGRRAGTLPGYSYSSALKNSDIVWSEQTIKKLFEEGPEHFTPGSKMPLQKIANAKIRDALIEFLKEATIATAPKDSANTDRGRRNNDKK